MARHKITVTDERTVEIDEGRNSVTLRSQDNRSVRVSSRLKGTSRLGMGDFSNYGTVSFEALAEGLDALKKCR